MCHGRRFPVILSQVAGITRHVCEGIEVPGFSECVPTIAPCLALPDPALPTRVR